MKEQVPQTFHIFYNVKSRRAAPWAFKIRNFIKKNYPGMKPDARKPDAVIVLGGDGTILKAARKYHEKGSVILGLNLGKVGFLASVRDERDFLRALSRFLSAKGGSASGGKGAYHIVERMMLSAQVIRKGKTVFTAEALNEIVVKNPLGMVELLAKISGHPVKRMRGTGLLVSTATGSTAYNLSAHGPIITPDIKCIIITELLGHSIPAPSIVIKYQNIIDIRVVSFRKTGILALSRGNRRIDVLLVADGESVFPLEEKDEVIIKNSPHLIKFAELEEHYFFKSLEEKFGFK